MKHAHSVVHYNIAVHLNFKSQTVVVDFELCYDSVKCTSCQVISGL